MGIKMAQFNTAKSFEDFRVTLDRVAMAAKWDDNTTTFGNARVWRYVENCLKKLIML
jgi:hypothetical protein